MPLRIFIDANMLRKDVCPPPFFNFDRVTVRSSLVSSQFVICRHKNV